MTDLRPYTADNAIFVRECVFGPQGSELLWFDFSSPRLQADSEANGLLSAEGGRLIVEEDGQAVGNVQWFQDHWGPAATRWCWEIGIALQPGSRGRGIGRRAQQLLRHYLLDHTRADRIQAVTAGENRAEQRALEKAGFRQEGVIRRNQWRAGRWHDQLIYSFCAAIAEPSGAVRSSSETALSDTEWPRLQDARSGGRTARGAPCRMARRGCFVPGQPQGDAS